MAVYYDKMALDNLKKHLVFHALGQKKDLPKNSGKTVQWFRRTPGVASTSALTEGTVPANIALSATSVSAVLSQYGQWTQTSDLIQMTSIDNELEHAVSELSYAMALTIDTLDRNLLDGDSTNAIQYANGKTALSATSATDVWSSTEGRKAKRSLQAQSVKPFDGTNFVAVLHVNNAYDMQGETTTGGWIDAVKYTDPARILNGELGVQNGIRYVQTENVSFVTAGTSGSAAVYNVHVLGEGAFGVVEFDGMGSTIVKKGGDQDTSNPLNQYATVGYKTTYANAILDGTRKQTVKAGSAF
jgi:N4-gp56 family major capsid protein